MKKLFCIGYLLLALNWASAGPLDAPVIEIDQLAEGLPGTGVVVVIPAGREFEVNVAVDGDVMEAGDGPIELNFKRKVYVYLPASDDEEPLFSWERQDWKEWKDLFNGSLSVGVKEPGSVVKIDLTLNGKE